MIIKLLSVQGFLSFGLSFGSVFVHGLVVCFALQFYFLFFFFLSWTCMKSYSVLNVDTAFLMTNKILFI